MVCLGSGFFYDSKIFLNLHRVNYEIFFRIGISGGNTFGVVAVVCPAVGD
jgi:hypothetical protein